MARPTLPSASVSVRRITLMLIAALALLPAASAWGDADPASDFLPGFDSYLPYGNSVAKPTQGQLDKLLKVARARHEPFKVAVIATPPDLGAVTALFNKPQLYARFLYREIKPIITGGDVTLLIVMPKGVGVIGRDATTRGGKAAVAVHPPAGGTPAGPGRTAGGGAPGGVGQARGGPGGARRGRRRPSAAEGRARRASDRGERVGALA